MKFVLSRVVAYFLVIVSTGAFSQETGCSGLKRHDLALALGAPALEKWLTWEVASCEDLVVNVDSVEFKLRDTTKPVHGGIRSEVAINFPFQEGNTVRYRWQMKLPAHFVADSMNRWWLLAQWHDQPDIRIGETWSKFPHKSPPVAIYLEQRNSVIGIGLIFDGKYKKSWVPIPLDEWLSISATIIWSTDENGSVILDINNTPSLSFEATGRNMNNSYQHYLKFGQYRHKSILHPSKVLFKDLDIKRSINE